MDFVRRRFSAGRVHADEPSMAHPASDRKTDNSLAHDVIERIVEIAPHTTFRQAV